MYAQQFGTIIQPQTYERSFSPLLVGAPEQEEGWKVSNHHDGYGRNLLHMPSMNNSTPINKRKPLPQEPTLYTAQEDASYYCQPVYHPHWQYDHTNSYYAQVPCTPMSAVGLDPNTMYQQQQQQQQQQPYMEASHSDHLISSPASLSDPEELPSANSSPVVVPSQLQQAPPKIIMAQNKNVRQITVRSINDDYRVWITVDPKETGESLAEKIHVIATFRTRKITSVTTASGRKVPLNKAPVFKNWQDMDDFAHGETWTVTWGPLKTSFMDKVFSRFIEA